LRRGGTISGLMTSLFSAKTSLFCLQKFPVRLLRETQRKTLWHRHIYAVQIPLQPRVSQISLYFSLLAGNSGRRPVRTRLRRQPASTVSEARCPTIGKVPTFPLVTERPNGLSKDRLGFSPIAVPLLASSLLHRFFNILNLPKETWFGCAETG